MKNIFERVFLSLRNIFKKKEKRKKLSKKGRSIALNSRFGHFLQNAEPNSEEYERAAEVVILCDEAASVTSTRLIAINRLKDIDEQLTEMDAFNKMSDETAGKLKDLLGRFVALGRDRNALKYQITSFDAALTTLDGQEDEAAKAIAEVKEAEGKQRLFKQDINYLQGEKSELEDERESLVNSGEFINRFTVGLLVTFGVSVAALLALYFGRRVNVFVPLTVLTILALVSVAMLYAMRRRIELDLALNAQKQKKAVKLINRKNSVYAHYTNFLNFEYRKYKVRNAETLRKNLKDYKNYKSLTKRMDSIRSIMSQTESEITLVLRESGINYVKTSLETFAKTFDIDDKKRLCRDLEAQKKATEKELAELDKKQEEMWNKLTIYDDADESEKRIIHDIIQAYADHAAALMAKTQDLGAPPPYALTKD